MNYFDLLAWVTENKSLIINCRINNIYSIGDLNNIFFFKLRCLNEDKNLILEPGVRINFTKYEGQKSINPKIRILRDLIRDSYITNIEILDEERILKIYLSNNKKIILELLPRGSLIILNEEDKIIFSTEYKTFKDRVIKPGIAYTLPPKPQFDSKNPLRSLGVPKEIIDNLHLNSDNIDELKKNIEDLKEKLKKGEIEPCIQKGKLFMPFHFDNCEKLSSFNAVIDEYFIDIERERVTQQNNEKLEAERKKLEKTVQEIKNSIDNYELQAEQLRNIGKKIMENYVQVENAIKNKQKSINIDGIEIELDPKLTPTKNASIFFEKAKEYSNKAKKAKETLDEFSKKLENLNSKINQRTEASRFSLIKKFWYEKYRWSITTNGFLVISGKDADQNESLVRKMLEDKDIFLHADIQGASTTIIKNPVNIQDQDIFDAAVLAASYSKAWKLGLATVDVFWVYGNQVSKSPPTGEYLPKGSFMIYGKKNYIKNVPLMLALGIEYSDEGIRVIVGSENSISNKVKQYIIISPGDELERTAERISKILSENLGIEATKELKNEILSILPGKSKIIKVVKLGNDKQ
ncbi:Rqc2 family fibronectin-binding protein [Acidianus manzaensis]|uniref:RNA-binding protein n=1 Tax=Acidianus manzaensis TaxID=282676 RepID=A0A1W6K0K1_9CREN|nr:NFACT family protein [Acidianus manzaensis]ARM75974.1 RNA-binding protein [Acidianus manzaensis]